MGEPLMTPLGLDNDPDEALHRALAAEKVREHALDSADAAQLLDMLGLE